MRQLRVDVSRQRAADTMQHARHECPSATAYLEETQQLDVRGVRVRLRQVRQQRLLGSVAIDRELLELQADTALQRWMRCSCCAQYAPQYTVHSSCGQFTVGARATEALRPTASSATNLTDKERPRVHVARACACVHICWLLERARQVAARNTQHAASTLRPCRVWQMTRDLCRAASCSATGAAQL